MALEETAAGGNPTKLDKATRFASVPLERDVRPPKVRKPSAPAPTTKRKRRKLATAGARTIGPAPNEATNLFNGADRNHARPAGLEQGFWASANRGLPDAHWPRP
ncbi:MAG: hypothetical protein ACRERU_13805, partial [Methylococcales bacterium]